MWTTKSVGRANSIIFIDKVVTKHHLNWVILSITTISFTISNQEFVNIWSFMRTKLRKLWKFIYLSWPNLVSFFQSNIKYNLPINHSALTCWKLHYNERRDIWDPTTTGCQSWSEYYNNLESTKIKYSIPIIGGW